MTLRPCEPRYLQTGQGWIAATPPDYPLAIGVSGDTRDEAGRRFIAAVAAWEELIEREEEPPTGR